MAKQEKSFITKCIKNFISEFKEDMSTITLRVIKEGIQSNFEDWDSVLQEHKQFIKDEACRLVLEFQDKPTEQSKSADACDQSPSREVDHHDSQREQKVTVKKVPKNEMEINEKKNDSESESESNRTSDSNSTDDEGARKGQGKNSKKAAKKMKKAKPEPTGKLEKEVLRLKKLAKRLGLTIPPSTYKGSPTNEELIERLEKWFKGCGLASLRPSAQQIAEMKEKIQLSRDLEGIDMTNVVRGKRRRGDEEEKEHESAAPRGKYRITPAEDSDDSS
eukprot:CAMPEP_0181334372 /NCGR_PEP_ID=MMETSP1101-20121128/26215_1 /TAXON_ID=46948 /ORGANISM="Rhodomonas abbreviata, Strain Caron Lab Isolate" /LENGTH=275 /DNA_ID=CAMNT_0023444325 /DNA_START=43 /DNA_END=870 /DNA_ORIENTATION=-